MPFTVTITSAAPAVPAGVCTVITVPVTLSGATAVPPIFTAVIPGTKPAPLIVTGPPPCTPPLFGAIVCTSGVFVRLKIAVLLDPATLAVTL